VDEASLSVGAPFCRGEPGMWGARIPGTLIDERRRALVMGHHSVRDSMRGPGGRAPLLGNPEDEFLRDLENAL